MYEAELEAELHKLMSTLAKSDLESEAELFTPATAPGSRCPVDSPTVIR